MACILNHQHLFAACQCWQIIENSNIVSYYFKTMQHINSLAPGRCGSNLISALFKLILQIDILSISYEIGLRRVPQCHRDTSTLVQVMAWCRPGHSPPCSLQPMRLYYTANPAVTQSWPCQTSLNWAENEKATSVSKVCFKKITFIWGI